MSGASAATTTPFTAAVATATVAPSGASIPAVAATIAATVALDISHFVRMPDIRISECPGYPDIQVGACIADRGADRGERRQYPPRPQPHSMSRVSTVLCACGMTADASLGMRMCVSGVCVCGH